MSMTRARSVPSEPKPRYYIFRPWRRTKSGEKLWARDYGLKAWRIPIY